MGERPVSSNRAGRTLVRTVKDQRYLLLMSIPFVVWVAIFAYTPLFGWIMAFQEYEPGRSMLFGQEWVGLKHFREFLTDRRFFEVLRNTLVMSGFNIVFGFVSAIVLAIIVNEARVKWFRKTVQTVSYLPHFVSWVIVSSIFYTLLSTDGGVVNKLLLTLGIIQEPVAFMAEGKAFWAIITVAHVWKEMGWNSIIYLAAISGIDPQLYEAGEVDGISRIGAIWHITLPGIRGTAVLLLVLAIGGVMGGGGFDASFLMGNSMTQTYSDNLAVYAFRYGISMTRYSMSTALSIFNSAVALILLILANRLSAFWGEGSVL